MPTISLRRIKRPKALPTLARRPGLEAMLDAGRCLLLLPAASSTSWNPHEPKASLVFEASSQISANLRSSGGVPQDDVWRERLSAVRDREAGDRGSKSAARNDDKCSHEERCPAVALQEWGYFRT